MSGVQEVDFLLFFILFLYFSFLFCHDFGPILEHESSWVCFFVPALFSLALVPLIRYWCTENVVSVA